MWSAAIPIAAVILVTGAFLTVRLLPSQSEPPITATTLDPRVVFAEFGLNEDRIYIAPADNPDDRTLVDTVAHAAGWGIKPAVAVAGPLLAYNALPDTAGAGTDSPAELWIVNVEPGDKVRLARDADLLIAPIFVDGGAGLVYRRTSGRQQELVRVAIDEMTRRVVHAQQTLFGLFPIGVDDDGALLFAQLSEEGTDIYSVREGNAPAFVFHASDHIARDWQLSPDGTSLSYLAPDVTLERVAYRARVVDLARSSEVALAKATPDAATEQYGPVWTPDGGGVTVGQEAFVQAAEPAVVLRTDGTSASLPAPARGFDVPLGWSADGRYLAVRSFDGRNSVEPGLGSTVLVDPQGQ
ncbi:MAG: hypothetical protein WD800_01255, partial [Dehalococcoidia bacterium]